MLFVIVKTSDEARDQLEFLQSKLDCCLVIDGDSLQVRSQLHGKIYISDARGNSCVSICSRMSSLKSRLNFPPLWLVDALPLKRQTLHGSFENILVKECVVSVTEAMM